MRHGLTANYKMHPVYRIWINIKQRCYSPKSSNELKNYKNKGIVMLESWKEDAAKFCDWVFSNGWKPGLTIDRINSNDGYFPENIQFLTKSENSKKVYKDNPGLNVGSNSHRTKLCDDDVREIRILLLKKMPHKEIALIKNTTVRAVAQISSNRTWKHLD